MAGSYEQDLVDEVLDLAGTVLTSGTIQAFFVGVKPIDGPALAH